MSTREAPHILDRLRQSQFALFLLVGIVSSAVYIAVMALVVDILRGTVIEGAVAAFLAGTAISYAGNTIWTFETSASVGNMAKFLVVTFMGMAMNIGIADILQSHRLHYFVVSAVVLTTVPVFNYTCHKLWTYH